MCIRDSFYKGLYRWSYGLPFNCGWSFCKEQRDNRLLVPAKELINFEVIYTTRVIPSHSDSISQYFWECQTELASRVSQGSSCVCIHHVFPLTSYNLRKEVGNPQENHSLLAIDASYNLLRSSCQRLSFCDGYPDHWWYDLWLESPCSDSPQQAHLKVWFE